MYRTHQRLKKGICRIAVCFILLLFCIPAAAQSDTEQEIISRETLERSAGALESETRQMLKDIGLEEVSPKAIYSLDFLTVIKSFFAGFRLTLRENSKQLLLLMAAVLLAAMAHSLSEDIGKGRHENIFGIAAALIISLCAAVPLSDLLAQSASSLKVACTFHLSVFPLMCTVAAAQGKSISAALCHAGGIASSELMGTLFSEFFAPVSNVLLALGISSSVAPAAGPEKMMKLVKKSVLIGLSACAAIYFALLSLRSHLSSAVDETALKTIKFASSNFVPVIGGAISDSAAAVAASLSVSKSAIGVFGMVCIAACFAPLFIKLFVWYIGLEAAAAAAQVFSLGAPEKALKNMADVVSIFMIVLLFSALIFFINFGVLLSLKGGS